MGSNALTAAGEVMLGDLFRSGFDIVDDHEDADAIVVNTCSFVEEAKTESLEVSSSVAYSHFRQQSVCNQQCLLLHCAIC